MRLPGSRRFEHEKKTFENWANSHLARLDLHIIDLAEGFQDGVRLCGLVGVLSNCTVVVVNPRPRNRIERLENVQLAFNRIVHEGGVKLVNIGPEDIEEGNTKLTMALLWQLILRYDIRPYIEAVGGKISRIPRDWLLGWLRETMSPHFSGARPRNLRRDWNDGILLSCLVNTLAPGAMPEWLALSEDDSVENIANAMALAKTHLNIPQLMSPGHMASPYVDEASMMTYLYRFVAAAKKRKPNPQLELDYPKVDADLQHAVKVYGPALENEVQANVEARFFIDTHVVPCKDMTVRCRGPTQPERLDVILDPSGHLNEIVFCAAVAGLYRMYIMLDGVELPSEPVHICVVQDEPDASRVKITKCPTWWNFGEPAQFDIDASEAGGSGCLAIGVSGPKIPANRVVVIHEGNFKFSCQVLLEEEGEYCVSVTYHGVPIPGSPFRFTCRRE